MTPKWISLTPPVTALNSGQTTNFMATNSPVVPSGTDPADIFKKYVPSDSRHLIFNCHGTPEPLIKLGRYVRPSDIDAFKVMNDYKLRVIWFSACNISVSTAGRDWCKAIAKATGCYVVAQTMAVPDGKVKFNCIEDYDYAMPMYVDPFEDMVARKDFFEKVGPICGFKKL